MLQGPTPLKKCAGTVELYCCYYFTLFLFIFLDFFFNHELFCSQNVSLSQMIVTKCFFLRLLVFVCIIVWERAQERTWSLCSKISFHVDFVPTYSLTLCEWSLCRWRRLPLAFHTTHTNTERSLLQARSSWSKSVDTVKYTWNICCLPGFVQTQTINLKGIKMYCRIVSLCYEVYDHYFICQVKWG